MTTATHSPSRSEHRMTVADLRTEIVGVDTPVPLLDGSQRPYVFLDNAASTPAFRSVLRTIEEFLPWYSGVHRGTGFKSLLSTELYDRAHEAIGRFVHADPAFHTVIFTKNTTECINKLSNRFAFRPGDVVVTTSMEHHSNDLPWRKNATVVHVGIVADGHLNMRALTDTLLRYRGRVRLVAVNGASNISGICSPIYEIAQRAHEAGAKIFVDAAQLAPHRAIDMWSPDDPGHIDFLALSAHKMYAPFGTGALVGPRSFFADGTPDMVGGGVVEIVTLDDVAWNEPPHKEEAGSPNVIGGIALAEAARTLQRVGMEAIAAHEHELLEYAYRRLKQIRGLLFYGPTEDLSDKVGVIAFNVEGMHNALVAAIIGTEAGIGVRNGCFCAHPYVKELLGITPEEDRRFTAEVLAGDKSHLPGMVRASLGCYNNRDDIDALAEILERIVRKEYRGTYIQSRATGAFHAKGYTVPFAKYLPSLDRRDDGSPERPFSEAS
jgi:cysteine desulfurase / selenocysteine lyase